MTDLSKSKMLRALLWLMAILLVMAVTSLADFLADKLPIWMSKGPHFIVESVVFWSTVGSAIWRWLSERVWVGRQANEAQP